MDHLRFVLLPLFALAIACETHPAPEGPGHGAKHVLVFVQAHKDAQINRMIVERGLWRAVDCLASSRSAFNVQVIPIHGQTARAQILFAGEARAGLRGVAEAQAMRQAFIQRGRTLLDAVYAPEAPLYADVLGSLFAIDDYITRRGVVPQVLYISDMIQRTGPEGYDFSGEMNGREITQCAPNLEKDYTSRLVNKSRMADMRVDVARVHLRSWALEADAGAPVTAEVQTPENVITTFWRDDVFTKLLRAKSTFHDGGNLSCGDLGWKPKIQ
jgi:hypothetical protein